MAAMPEHAKFFEEIKDYVSFEDGGFSYAKEKRAKEFADMLNEAEEYVRTAEENVKIELDRLRDELVAAGRPKQEAELEVKLWAAMAKMHSDPVAFLKKAKFVSGEEGTQGAYEQSQYRSKAKSLAEYRNEVKSANIPVGEKGKFYFDFNAKSGHEITMDYDAMVHTINRHGELTHEQLNAIHDNIDNIVDYQTETKKKGHNDGKPVLMKINTPLGYAGVSAEFFNNGKIKIASVFYDTETNIDNWLNKGGSKATGASENSASLLGNSPLSEHSAERISPEGASSDSRHALSVDMIQQKLGIVNRNNLLSQEVFTQAEEVRKQYTNADGTMKEGWHKAPNGEESNLTEEQWCIVRTPAFKEWFGDWEYLSENRIDITDNERNTAKDVLNNLRDKVLFSTQENIEATISKKGRGKMISNGALAKSHRNGFTAEQHFSAVANIEKLFRNSVRTNIREDKNKDIEAIEHFSTAISFDGQNYNLATFTVKVTENAGRKIYSIELLELEKPEGTVPGTVKKTSTSATSSFDELNISKIADKVNNCSKVVDENGEPRVVYHGTNSTFDTFSLDYIGTGRGDVGFFGKGFYFAYSESEARMYGSGNIIGAFLNLKNPFNIKKEFEYYNRERSFDIVTASVVNITNFARKFPEITKEHHVTGFDKETGEAIEMSLTEFADLFEKIYKELQYTVEEIDNAYGEKEVVVLGPKVKRNYDNYSWEEPEFQFKFPNKKLAENRLNVIGNYLDEKYDRLEIPSLSKIIMETDFTEEVKKRGHDGVIQSEEGDEAVAFYPNQIKSATANNGNFDANDPNIYHQLAGEDFSANSISQSETITPEQQAEQKLNADVKAWGEVVDKLYKKEKVPKQFKVMDTPLVMQLIEGVNNYPVYMGRDKFYEIRKEHPGMTRSIFKQIPKALTDPIFIFKSKTVPGRIIVALELLDNKGVNVVVPFEINSENGRNIITSDLRQRRI